MKKIPISGGSRWYPILTGKFALVDDDFEWLNKFKWCSESSVGYARNRKLGKMHRLIMGNPLGKFIDHINHNTLDNRKSNLRICTNRQNHQNTLIHKTNKVGYKGVSWHKSKWETRIRFNDKKLYIGEFNNKLHAAMAYDIWAKELYGEYASLNFPLLECPH